MPLLHQLQEGYSSGERLLAVLIDPDKINAQTLSLTLANATRAKANIVMVGGSLVDGDTDAAVRLVKEQTHIPVVLFPGNAMHFAPSADAIFLLSLISGRNPDFLIGNHVHVAGALKRSGIEVIPVGYMLIDGGVATSVQYMSNTMPIPSAKIDIAVATALAGEQLGLKAIYLEAGSGAANPVPHELIAAVCRNVTIPVIVGGGIRSAKQLQAAYQAGATMVVVGNALEKNPELLLEFGAR